MNKHIRFDWAIKRLLRQKANFVVLEGFLSELLKFDVKIAEIIESEGNKEDANDKYNRIDILVKNTEGELMLIEIQNERENDYFHRMNYGQAKLITEHINESDPYEKVKKVFSINIVYFDLGQGTDYVYKGLTEFRGIHTNDLLQLKPAQLKNYPIKNVSDIFATYYVIKVNKFNNVAVDTLDEWIYFLKNNEIKDEFKAKGLTEAKEKLRKDNLTAAERQTYEQYIKQKRIEESEIKSALLEGEIKAEKKYFELIERERIQKEEAKTREKEAKAREEEAKTREEQAKNQLHNAIIQLSENGQTAEQIAHLFSLPEAKIAEIISK